MMAPGRPRLPMLPGREPFAVCVAVPTGRTFAAGAIEVGGRQGERRPRLLQDHVRPSQRRLRGEHEARKCQDGEVSVHAVVPVTGNGAVIRSMMHLIERGNSPTHSYRRAKVLTLSWRRSCLTCPVLRPRAEPACRRTPSGGRSTFGARGAPFDPRTSPGHASPTMTTRCAWPHNLGAVLNVGPVAQRQGTCGRGRAERHRLPSVGSSVSDDPTQSRLPPAIGVGSSLRLTQPTILQMRGPRDLAAGIGFGVHRVCRWMMTPAARCALVRVPRR